MNNLIIFGAKYLYFLSAIVAILSFLRQPKEIRKRILILGLVSLPIMYIVAKLAGFLHYSSRPFIVGHFTPLIPHKDDNGFPSDHTLIVAGIASIIFLFRKRLGMLLWVIAFIVGMSRVLAGVHHLADILGSMVIAVLVLASVNWLMKKRGMV